MPRTKKSIGKSRITASAINSASVKRNTEDKDINKSLLQKLQSELQLNQSYLSLVLGLLIVLVGGILIFNYFKQTQSNVGPAQTVTETVQKDVEPENLPGKYTVKGGDTLFLIAEKYYKDGYKYNRLVEANKIANENTIEVGQVLDIPKIEEPTAELATSGEGTGEGTGGAVNQTIWGERITGDTYTVVEGDWLSTIAGRAYGDVSAYEKIAKENNIQNPDVIHPGTVLKLSR